MSQGAPTIWNWQGKAFSSHIEWAGFQCAILESPSDTRMVLAPSATTVSPENYESGILFGSGRELRWRKRRNGQFHVVVIEDQPSQPWPAASAVKSLTPVDAAQDELPRQVLLWGEPRGAGWYEARIPRPIEAYPPDLAGGRVAVQLAHYRLTVPVPSPFGPAESRDLAISRYRALSAAVLRQES